jgi:hypothetical protein
MRDMFFGKNSTFDAKDIPDLTGKVDSLRLLADSRSPL